MKAFLTKILTWTKAKLKSFSFRDWAIAILIGLCIIFYVKSCSLERKSLSQAKSVRDTTYVYQNKKGEDYTAKDVQVQELSDLKKMNRELYDEVKSLRDNPLTVTKVKLLIKTDTVYARVESKDSVDSLQYRYRMFNWTGGDKFYSISGQTRLRNDFKDFQTKIFKMQMDADLTMDLIDQKDHMSVIVKSSNPYLKVDGIYSVMLDPRKSDYIKQFFKPKRWGIGPYIGVGFDKDLKLSPQIGIGIQYNFIRF